MAKHKNPATYTAIGKFIRSAIFNPNKDYRLRIMADVANPSYYEEEAILLVKEAQMLRRDPGLSATQPNLRKERLIRAIRLLALAYLHGPKED